MTQYTITFETDLPVKENILEFGATYVLMLTYRQVNGIKGPGTDDERAAVRQIIDSARITTTGGVR